MEENKKAIQTCKIRREGPDAPVVMDCDICVLGAGSAGLSAAVSAARMGKKVVLVDQSPHLGGQTYNSIIGTFCGFYSSGHHGHLVTRGLAEEMLTALREMGGLYDQPPSHMIIPIYDENIFLRWAEGVVLKEGIEVLLGTTVTGVDVDGRRIKALHAVNRYGTVTVTAKGFVDASGDAVLAWQAGAACNISDGYEVLGTQIFTIEGVNYDSQPPTDGDICQRLVEKGDEYGLRRKKGLVFLSPERGDIAICNLTHVDTPLDPVKPSRISIEGKDQVDRVVHFLRTEFPETYGKIKVRTYGQTGIRQTRWISSVKQLTMEDVRSGYRPADAVARTAWPVELHQGNGYIWEIFPEDHVHYIPLSCMISPELDNYAAAGRCIDGDVGALASVRVMGPCMATGDAAAKALCLAGEGSIHEIDFAELQTLISYNIND